MSLIWLQLIRSGFFHWPRNTALIWYSVQDLATASLMWQQLSWCDNSCPDVAQRPWCGNGVAQMDQSIRPGLSCSSDHLTKTKETAESAVNQFTEEPNGIEELPKWMDYYRVSRSPYSLYWNCVSYYIGIWMKLENQTWQEIQSTV